MSLFLLGALAFLLPQSPGVLAKFEGKGGQDSRTLPRFALFVPKGRSPSLFLSPGPFRLRMKADLRLSLRDRFRFALEGRGEAILRIGHKVLLSGPLNPPGQAPHLSKRIRLRKGANPIEIEYRSPASGPAQIRLLWQSSDFPLEPLPAHLLSSPPPPKGDTHSRSELVALSRASCMACHTDPQLPQERLPGFLSLQGPDLGEARSRLRLSWFLAWVQNPKSFRPRARMPRLLHGEDSLSEARDLAAFLGLEEGERAEADPAQVREGCRLFRELRCASCHSLDPIASPASPDSGTPSQASPLSSHHSKIPLHKLAWKFRTGALARFLLNPTQHRPRSAMPQFSLQPAQASALAAFLQQGRQKGTAFLRPSPSPKAGDPNRGRALFRERACSACHRGVPPKAPPLPLQAPKAPPYLKLPPGKPCPRTKALRLPLSRLPLGLPVDEAAGALMLSLRCASCHEGAHPRGLPSLEAIGEKLRPSALRALFQGRAPRARPWLKAKMPAFAAYADTLVQGLCAEVGLSDKDVAKGSLPRKLAQIGKKLVSNQGGFSCVLCHAVGNTKALQVFEVEGINFALISHRLRKPYYDRWMWNPQRIVPSTKMPRFGTSEGSTAFTEILDGDAKKQFDAIWTYLEALGEGKFKEH